MRLHLSKAFISLFCIILLGGNALRFIPIQFLFGSVNAGEIFLYVCAIFIFPLFFSRLLTSSLYIVAMLVVMASLFIGLLKWGFESTAVLYSIRLLMQITVAALIGNILFELFGCNAVGLAVSTSKFYFYLSVISFVILLAFPESTALWAVLGDSGVEFSGDPHSGRLVSTYFDPNFFSAIIALPLVLAWNLYFRERSVRILLYAAVMTIADLLTFSRSGLSLLILTSICLALVSIPKNNLSKALNKSFLVLFFVALIGALSFFLFPELYERLFGRFVDVGSDASALARLDSFWIGMKLIAEEPILGYGYNYGLLASTSERGLGLDSSFQVLILNFGLVLSILTVFAYVLWTINTSRVVKIRAPIEVSILWKQLTIYLFLSLLWASNFNQLIFYTWWLMPVLAGMFYFDSFRRSHKNSSAME